MQSKNNLIETFKNSYFKIIKTIILLGILLGLYFSIKNEENKFVDILYLLLDSFTVTNVFLLMLTVLLSGINWGFEAKKWSILSQKIEKISFKNAFEAVLVGIALGFLTPANLGDYAGRIWKLNVKNKLESIGAILLGNGIQFYVSLFFGTISFFYLYYIRFYFSHKIIPILLGIMLFCLILGIFFFSKPSILVHFTKKIKSLEYTQKYLRIISQYTFQDIAELFLYALLRYLTFSLQYIILLFVFKIKLPILDIFAVTNMVFYAKTLVPAINFMSDIGVREISSIYFFKFYGINTAKVMLATFSLWFINLLLPAIIGFYYIIKIKKK